MKVELYKDVYNVTNYKNVIDTTFTQLIPQEEPIQEPLSVTEFFKLYNELFYQIPIVGDENSHEYIAKRSLDYIGGDIVTDNEKALLEEINRLRQQLLESNKNIADISALV